MITTKEKSGQRQDNKNQQNNSGPGNMPNENAGKTTNSRQEVSTPHETEANEQREGADSTYIERNEVTPPNRKEFPSVGTVKTDFESRPQGRTTGRMIGHEPGTEGI